TSLPDNAAVEAVYLGDDGVLSGGDAGLVAIELSTVDPDVVIAIGEEAEQTGIEVIGGPVSGGASGAAAGNLTMMLGGDSASIERSMVQDVLESISTDRYHTGELGSSHTVKLLNNTLAMGTAVLGMEVMGLGAARGLDPRICYETIGRSSGGSKQFEKRLRNVLNRTFDHTFTVEYALKDVGLYLEMAEKAEYPTTLAAIVHSQLERAYEQGYGDKGPSAVAKLYEEAVGTEVATDEPVPDEFVGYGTVREETG
ncbi:MAG: NAD(P)-dependent oxidoreductase, partial [Salinirussus sp.]